MTDRPTEDPSTFSPLARLFLWCDDPAKVTRLVYGIYAVCGLLVVVDFLYTKKVYLAIEKFPAFYAIYGFFMCAALVICAKGMRIFLMRDEDYYAPYDTDSEDVPEVHLDRTEHNG